MMSKTPVAGVVWQTMHYLIGLERLGYETYYVEAHARAPSMLMMDAFDGVAGGPSGLSPDASGSERRAYGSRRAAEFIDRNMRRFGLAGRWAFLALHEDGRSYGLGDRQLRDLYASAAFLINLHGATEPLPELAATGRLVFLETDPVQMQIELHERLQWTIDFLDQHCAYFTFGENYGNPDCGLPVSDRYLLRPTRQPVVLDFWPEPAGDAGGAFTTIGNWRQSLRELMFEEQTYGWSKHEEFLKFLDLPARSAETFELALSSYEDQDRQMLNEHGWRVRDALSISTELDAYRDYVAGSRGEFTVAKDQNIRFRSGWFSDRSATYLASGRPVISQETGFSSVLPTGEGLFGFSTLDDVLRAIEAIRDDYGRHSRAARELARENFSHEVVLGRLLEDLGEAPRGSPRTRRSTDPYPPALVLAPRSRRPTVLPETTIEAVESASVPAYEASSPTERPSASIVVVTFDNLVFNRLSLETVLANTEPGFELIVIDNASRDGTPDYLERLAERNPNVVLVRNDSNVGFAGACNQGLALARGELLVLLNNDTMVPPGWLSRLADKLRDAGVGLVGPVTNRIGNEAEVEARYTTWGGFLAAARERAEQYAGGTFDIRTLTMFCLAMRRDAYERIGPLDERFAVGLLEDDDYSMRAQELGYGVMCADDVLVHHFGEGSFGKLVPTGEYARVLEANRKRFEEKWGVAWQPYGRRPSPRYAAMTERIRSLVQDALPPESTVLVVSRGDDELLNLPGLRALHFPTDANGSYAGHHPADSDEAVRQLEASRERGGEFILFPETSRWWLEHYEGLRAHLERNYDQVVSEDDACVIFALNGSG